MDITTMKPSDWYLDLQDLLGRFLPGIAIIIELIFLFHKCDPSSTYDFIQCKASALNISVAIIISYIVGSFSTFVTFRFGRDILSKYYRKYILPQEINKKDKSLNLIRFKFLLIISSIIILIIFFIMLITSFYISKIKNNIMVNLMLIAIAATLYLFSVKILRKHPKKDYQNGTINVERFMKYWNTEKIWKKCKNQFDGLNENAYWKIQPYCKITLIELSPQSFLHLKKIEAHINFYTGITIPLIIGTIAACYTKTDSNINLLFAILFFVILVVNIYAMIVETESENALTFILYHSVMEKYEREHGKCIEQENQSLGSDSN